MGTRFEDQSLVAETAQSYGKAIPSFGYHPWFSYLIYDDKDSFYSEISESDIMELKKRHYPKVLNPEPSEELLKLLPIPTKLSVLMEELEERLNKFPNALVGEIGLDRGFRIPEIDEAVEGPKATPVRKEGQRLSDHRVAIEHQKLIFELQLRLAGKLGRPVSVHGVACHGAVFDTFRELWKGHEVKVERNRDIKMRRRRRKGDCEGDEKYEYLPDMDEQSNSEDEEEEEEVKKTAWTPKPYPPRICLHSFSAPLQTLNQYLKRPTPTTQYPSELFFSFSTTINTNPSRGHLSKVEELIKNVPESSLLVESDLHTAGPEQDKHLGNAAAYVCKIRGWKLEEGVPKISTNWNRFIYGK